METTRVPLEIRKVGVPWVEGLAAMVSNSSTTGSWACPLLFSFFSPCIPGLFFFPFDKLVSACYTNLPVPTYQNQEELLAKM